MSYATQYELTMSTDFRARVTAASVDAATRFVADNRNDVAALANSILALADNAAGMIKLAARQFPDETDPANIDDAEIRAAVEAAWPMLARALFPEESNRPSSLPTG